MKKLFLIFLIINLMLPAVFVNAAGRENPRLKNAVGEKVQNDKAAKEELKQFQIQISSNKIKLVNMKKDANNSFNKAKNKIKQLLKKKDNMTQEQIDLLNEAIDGLQIDSKAINDTSEELNGKYLNLQNAMSGTDNQLIRQFMIEIINLQKTSINNLQQAIMDMDRISKM